MESRRFFSAARKSVMAIAIAAITVPALAGVDPVENEAMVKYLLGDKKKKNIFTSRYKLNLPTVAELKAEIKREFQELTS